MAFLLAYISDAYNIEWIGKEEPSSQGGLSIYVKSRRSMKYHAFDSYVKEQMFNAESEDALVFDNIGECKIIWFEGKNRKIEEAMIFVEYVEKLSASQTRCLYYGLIFYLVGKKVAEADQRDLTDFACVPPRLFPEDRNRLAE